MGLEAPVPDEAFSERRALGLERAAREEGPLLLERASFGGVELDFSAAQPEPCEFREALEAQDPPKGGRRRVRNRPSTKRLPRMLQHYGELIHLCSREMVHPSGASAATAA